MSERTLSYADAIIGSQRAWDAVRAQGLHSLLRKHQTVEIPNRWSEAFQEILLNALPIPERGRRTIRAEHPTIRLGIALGLDDREKINLFRRPHHMLISSLSPISNHTAYNRGIVWANELMTGAATHDTIKALHETRNGMPYFHPLRSLLSTRFAQTDPSLIPDQRHLSLLQNLLKEQHIRTKLIAAWFKGDSDRADALIRKHSNMTLDELTMRLGKTSSYRRREGKQIEAASYQLTSGIAYSDSTIPWVLTRRLALNLVIAAVAPPVNVLHILLNIVGGLYTGLTIGEVGPFIPSALAHEVHHYFGEGEGHFGWYPMELRAKKSSRF